MLVPDRLTLTLGAKLEHHDLTGVELQPNARLLWTPSRRQTLWGSVARAVRTPGRGERDGTINQAHLPRGWARPCDRSQSSRFSRSATFRTSPAPAA